MIAPSRSAATRSLKPKSVCRHVEGIVITTWRRLAESRGYVVVPEGAQLDTAPGSDPAYRLRSPGLYSFVARG